MATKSQHPSEATGRCVPHTMGLKPIGWAMMWVFIVWLIIGHGFWLGWQYGIHALSPGDIVFIPYSEKIFIGAALIALIAGGVLSVLKMIQFSLGHFTLINVFDPTSSKEVLHKEIGKSHV